jgi:hypothetical protein
MARPLRGAGRLNRLRLSGPESRDAIGEMTFMPERNSSVHIRLPRSGLLYTDDTCHCISESGPLENRLIALVCMGEARFVRYAHIDRTDLLRRAKCSLMGCRLIPPGGGSIESVCRYLS